MSVKAKYAHLPPLTSDIGERLERLVEILEQQPVRLTCLFVSVSLLGRLKQSIASLSLPQNGSAFVVETAT